MAQSDERNDEQFLTLVTKGAECLQAGKIAEAKDAFEAAIKRQPDHPQARNMHALCMFRLGHYDEAESAFRELIQNNPTEPSLRLNLSMVHLKCGELTQAQRELERVLELSPGHARAMSYMGLVHERIGNFSEAAIWYREANNDKRAQQMEIAAKALKQESSAFEIPVPAPPPTAAPVANVSEIPTPGDPQFREIATGTFERPPLPELLKGTAQLKSIELKRNAPSASQEKDDDVPAPPPLADSLITPLPIKSDENEAAKSTAKPPQNENLMTTLDELALPTRIKKDVLSFSVDEVAYLRTDRLVGLAGQFEVEPLNRRYRGRRTDSLFGGNEAPMIAALGTGLAWLDCEDHKVTTLGLDEEEFYLLERALFAFSAGLVWENGRLPADVGRELDLDIVHLRGSGRAVIGTSRPLFGVPVAPDRPVTLLTERLVGWNGQVVPYRGPFPGLPEHANRPHIVRFEGEGSVLCM